MTMRAILCGNKQGTPNQILKVNPNSGSRCYTLYGGNTLKIGDRVRLTKKRLEEAEIGADEGALHLIGVEGTLYEIFDNMYLVEWDNGMTDERHGGWFQDSLEAIEMDEFLKEKQKWYRFFNENR